MPATQCGAAYSMVGHGATENAMSAGTGRQPQRVIGKPEHRALISSFTRFIASAAENSAVIPRTTPQPPSGAAL